MAWISIVGHKLVRVWIYYTYSAAPSVFNNHRSIDRSYRRRRLVVATAAGWWVARHTEGRKEGDAILQCTFLNKSLTPHTHLYYTPTYIKI